ncbi:MAG TPA: cupin domain-containing protein [Clostridiales bacterium]|nr:cupin domain-containing protein [Clostridiales bacterium]
MFVKNQEVIPTDCGEGVSRRILGTGGTLMMVEVTFKKGGVGTPHTHVHEQVSYVAKGSFDFTLNGETRRIAVGDSVYIPSGAVHGTVALEDSVIVDVFTPIREDFLAK